jgi:hypothetical protein
MLLEGGLSDNILILLLSLHRLIYDEFRMIVNKDETTYLNPHHLQLKHLHLHLGLGLGSHIGGKTWAEGDAIWVHAMSGLMVREGIDWSIGRSYIPILRDVAVEYVFILGGVGANIENASRGSSMRVKGG